MPLPTRNVVGTYPGQAGKTIRFTLTDTVSDESDGDTALAGTVVTATIDSQGDFSIALFCQGATLNGPPIYTARPLFGLAPKYTISVPAGSGSIDLSQLITLPPTPTPPTAFAQLVDLTAETARATAAEAAEATARATADALAVPLTQKGAAGGVATLDGAGTIPDAQIPATITRDTELTAAVSAAVSALVAGAPGALDTLDELAAAFGDDANFAATVTAALAGKQPLDADLTAIAALSTTSYGRAFLALADASAAKTALSLVKGDVGLGNVDNTADTAKPVSTAQQTALDLKAPLASPALTGTPTAPTQTAGNSSTRLATTAYTDTAVATQHTADNGTYMPLVDPTAVVTTLNDNFTRSNGALGTDPKSGYTWAAAGASPPTITSNIMVASAHPGTCYGQFWLQRAPVGMRGAMSFVPGGGTDASPSPMVLATSSVNNQASPAWYLIHPQFTRTGYQVQKAINNVFTTLASGNWTTPVPADATVLPVGWDLFDTNGKLSPTGTVLKLYGPNGEVITITDSDFAWLNGRYGFASIEPQDANSPKGRWHTVTTYEGRPVNPLYGPRPQDLWIPDQGICASLDPGLGTVSNLTPLASGTVYCVRLTLPGGVPINWLEWWSTGTAAGTPLNQWAALLDLSGRVVAVSSDLTTTAWAANSKQRFTITDAQAAYKSASGQFVPPGPMTVWAALMVKASTVPSIVGIGSGGGTGPQNNPPNPAGASSTGQTTPPAVGAFLAKPSVTASGIPLCVAG